MAQSLKNIMGAGMGAETGKLVNGTVADGLVATGSGQADALQLTGDVNVTVVVNAATGVVLPPVPQPGDEILIANLGSSPLNVYPSSGGSIQGGLANTPYVLAVGATGSFFARTGSKSWIILSSGGSAPAIAPTLGALSFSATSFTVGAVASGTINGATALSTITATGLPAGLTINGAARTEAWDGTGTPGTGSISVTETLAGASNSPRVSVISYSIAAASGTLTISTAPTISGDAVVGQTIFATNGTYSATPDSYTPAWSVGGVVQSDQTGTTLLVLDDYAGLAIGYSEIAHKSAYTDSASNAATSTGAVTTIDNGGTASSIPNAITALSRTSTSGDNSSAMGLTFSVTFAANVYEGYYLRAQVFSDGALTTQTQDVFHLLTHADLQSGATINLLPDGLTKLGPTAWLQLGVYTTSPNGYGYSFTYGTTISPTDAVVAMTWSATDKTSGVTLSTDHLTMTNTTGSGGVRASRGIGTGKKVYWELTGVTTQFLDAADASASLTTFFLGSPTDGWTATNDAGTWYNGNGGQLAYGSSIRNLAATWTGTDVLGLSLDTTGGSPILAAYKNGTLLTSVTMASISLPIYPACQGNSGTVCTLNAGITPGGTDGVAHPQTGFVNP